MLGKVLCPATRTGKLSLHFTIQKKAGGIEARKEGTSLSFTSCMVGMSGSPYGVFVEETQGGGNPRQTWPASLGVDLTPDPPHPTDAWLHSSSAVDQEERVAGSSLNLLCWQWTGERLLPQN